jgi:hypothetical protein
MFHLLSGLNPFVIMRTRFNIFLSVFIFLMCSTAVAQRNAIDTLIRKFDNYRKNNYQEKIYLHTDQSSYLTGEIIWFSAYLVEGSFHKPGELSKVAYVEVLDKNNAPVLQSKIELIDGRGSGSLFLSPSISSGNFVIRAYTNWMKNFSSEFYFHKSITIINTFAPLDAKKNSSSANSYDAQFFPEGGNLLAGVTNTIGFRVTDKAGKGIPFRGTLLNANNDTLMHFAPTKFGIGNFTFQPEEATDYRAVVKDDEGRIQTFNLPKVIASGYALRVIDSVNQFIVDIQSKSVGNNALPVYIFIHARNQVTHADVRYLQGGPVTLRIDKKNMAEGISHITLFDSYLNPVSERLVFCKPVNKLSITPKADQGEYGLRRPVNITVTTSASGNIQTASLSMAVFKKDSITGTGTSGILDYLWLTSDLRGTIESPEYYLNTDSPEVMKAVDNLMITHGWRRFDWTNVLAGKKEMVKFLPEALGHIVTGEIRDENNTPAKGIVSYLSSPSRIPRLFISRSNGEGKVHYIVQNFYGPRKLIAHTNYKTADSVYQIKINNPFSTDFATHESKPLSLSPLLEKQLLSRSISMQVTDVFFREKQEKFVNAVTDTLAFYGKGDEFYKLDDYTRFPVMEEVMREYVPGVLVRKRKDGFHFMVMDDVNKNIFSFSATPFMMIDGVPFFDEDEIMIVDPLKIKTLDVMRRRYHLGLQTFPGVISFTTYGGDLSGFKINPHSVVLDYEGLQLQREFYAPRYENQKHRESRLPDPRYLLYWNPSVTTDKDGKQQVSFYSSDIPGEYQVVIEGLAPNGAAGTATTSFVVKSFNN